MASKYLSRSRISDAKFREIIRLFSLDIEATKIAVICKLNRNSVNRILRLVRTRLAEYCEEQSPYSGVVEVDESYFGARRVKGKRGRGAYGKTIVFGIFKRNGHVYTEIVPDCSKSTLQAVIRGRVSLDSIINSDGWRGYNGLVDVGYEKHLRVQHSKDQFVRGQAHLNGIEGFWWFAKVRMAKFRGMNKSTFYLHLKETEFRYNHRQDDIYKIILKLCRDKSLS